MNTHADKTQESKSWSAVKEASQKKSSGEAALQFVDNRPDAIAQRKLQDIANNGPQVKKITHLQGLAVNYSQRSNMLLGRDNWEKKPVQRVLQDNDKHRMPGNEDELRDDINNGNVKVSSGQTFLTNQDRRNINESKKWTVSYNVNMLDLMGRNFEGNDLSYVIHAHHDIYDNVTQMHAKTADDGDIIYYINSKEIRSLISNT